MSRSNTITTYLALAFGVMIGQLMWNAWTREKPQYVKPPVKVYTQICEKCGAEWQVIPSGEKVPPATVPWCFHDGAYCDEGLRLVISPGSRDEFIAHCLTCESCRCTFTPEQWREISDQLKKD